MRQISRLWLLLVVPCHLVAGGSDPHVDDPCTAEAAAPRIDAGVVTLPAALEAALGQHPDLVIAACEMRAAEGRMLQAGLRPNPEAAIELENFGGSHTRRGFDSAETTLQISQLIELGGKRAKRLQLAGSDRDIAAWDSEIKRVAVITETRKAFIEVLAAQTRVTLAAEMATLAGTVLRGVAAKVKAGRVSPIEETRATVMLTRAEIDLTNARNRLATTRRALALQWGGAATFDHVSGRLDALPAYPALDDVIRGIDRNPALARWSSELRRRGDALALASATGTPDIALSGGVRQFAESDDVGFVIGVSVPLPIFDRSQGAVIAARAEVAAADAGLVAERRSLLNEAYAQHQSLQSAAAEESSLRLKVLPLAEQVFEATSRGYRQGKFGLLEVLDAQRTLFESRGLYVDAQARYHLAVAELERLTGTGLGDLGTMNSPNPGAQ